MNLALFNNIRITATPNFKNAFCPLCYEEVIAKCGTIKQWHWSHKSNTECDEWGEGETDWHLDWKNQFPKEQQEVIIRKLSQKHRADIFNRDNIVIELQNSPISIDDINKRESFYDNMIWLINSNSLARGLVFKKSKDYGMTFRWKHPSKTLWNIKKPFYIDLNNNYIFLIKKIYQNVPCGGYGILLTKEDFLLKYRGKNGTVIG